RLAVQERRRVHEPGQRLDAPSLRDRELEFSLICESDSLQHVLARVAVHLLFPPSRDAVARLDDVHPPLERLLEGSLPGAVAAVRRPSPQESDATAGAD